MRGMALKPIEHWSSKALAVLAILAIIASPLILLGIAMAEQTLFRTSYTTYFYEMIGIRTHIQALSELLFPYT